MTTWGLFCCILDLIGERESHFLIFQAIFFIIIEKNPKKPQKEIKHISGVHFLIILKFFDFVSFFPIHYHYFWASLERLGGGSVK